MVIARRVTEAPAVNKSVRSFPRPLADLLAKSLGEAFRRQGFASTELVTRWNEVVGSDIAAHCEPEKILWQRAVEGEPPEPGTLVLRVEGPVAVEIQHLSGVVLERVNRFFGWQAVGAIRLRQAPLGRRAAGKAPAEPDPAAVARIASGLTEIGNDSLRNALARLGAATKRT
jgi:hypothetical protein